MTKLILLDTIPNIHSLLIVKDNHLIYENYFEGEDEKVGSRLGYISHAVSDLHDCRSITKSITSRVFYVSYYFSFLIFKGLTNKINKAL